MKRIWNKCDCCGKFISFKDFNGKQAIRNLITPDAEGACEEYETLCVKCKEK